MSVLLAYLAKERRDGRALLIGIPVATTMVLVIGAFLIPRRLLVDPFFPKAAALMCLALGLVAIAADVLPSEDRRGKLRFLHRLPGGLGAAYRAKVIHVLGALAFLMIAGYLAAKLVALAGGASWSVKDNYQWGHFPLPKVWFGGVGLGVLLLLIGAGWVLAVSTWIPRGALAVPVTAMTLGLFGLPLWLLYRSAPGLRPYEGIVGVFVLAHVIAPYWIGWRSFVRGRKHGGGAGSSAWRGIAATAVLFVPAWGFAAFEAQDHLALDPTSERFRIGEAYVGRTGRFLFLNVAMERRMNDRRGATYPVVVDSESGLWWSAGKAGERFTFHGWNCGNELISIRDVEMSRRSRGSKEVWRRYYNDATGALVKSSWGHLRPDEVRRTSRPVPQTSSARWALSWHSEGDFSILHYTSRDGVVGIEDGRRIVHRFGPGAEFEVLFPRGEDR